MWLPHRLQYVSHVVDESAELAGWRIIREMVKHIWPREHPKLKARVVIALGLLIGAKVRLKVLIISCCFLAQERGYSQTVPT